MKAKQLLANLAKLSGMADDHTALQTVLGNAALDTVEVPDEVANIITGGLLTHDAAKQNPVLKAHFTALALKGVDTKVDELLDELEVDDATKTEIKGVKSSYERVAALTKKIKDLESKKYTGKDGEKAKLVEQINKLNADLAKAKEDNVKAINDLNSKHSADKLNWNLDSIYNSFDYANPYSGKDVTPEQKKLFMLTAKTLVNDALKAKNLGIHMDDNGNTGLKTSEGTEYFENNVKVELPAFIKKTLLNAKAIKVTDVPKGNGQQQSTRKTGSTGTGGSGESSSGVKNTEFMSALEGSISDLGEVPQQ